MVPLPGDRAASDSQGGRGQIDRETEKQRNRERGREREREREREIERERERERERGRERESTCNIEDVQPVRVVVVVESKLVADGGGVPPEVDIERILASGDATPADPGHMVLSVGGPADLPRDFAAGLVEQTRPQFVLLWHERSVQVAAIKPQVVRAPLGNRFDILRLVAKGAREPSTRHIACIQISARDRQNDR